MNRLMASTLALAMAASATTASAQTYGAAHLQPSADPYERSAGGQYDYARVLRVDPVFDSRSGYGSDGYGSDGYSRNCYQRDTIVSGYDRYTDGRYGRDRYGRDDYRGDSRSYDPYGARRSGSQAGGTVATVVGGLVGAVLGSQVGGGSGRYATSAIGSMVGGMAGRHIYEEGLRQRDRTGTVRVCDPVPVDSYAGHVGRTAVDGGVTAYDVTYEYAGRRYATRTNHHPGDRIRVRVDVRPE